MRPASHIRNGSEPLRTPAPTGPLTQLQVTCSTDYSLTMAGVVLFVIPLLVPFVAGERRPARGAVHGAVTP